MADALKIGVAGLGTVGVSVVQLLEKHAGQIERRTGRSLTVTAVSARNRTRDRGIDTSGFTWFDDPVAMANAAELDIFVELIGGEAVPSVQSVLAVPRRGVHVGTANKALILQRGFDLARVTAPIHACRTSDGARACGLPMKPMLNSG